MKLYYTSQMIFYLNCAWKIQVLSLAISPMLWHEKLLFEPAIMTCEISVLQACKFIGTTYSVIVDDMQQVSSLCPACHCKLARQPSPPGIRLRRSPWRTGKARRPGARAGRSQLE